MQIPDEGDIHRARELREQVNSRLKYWVENGLAPREVYHSTNKHLAMLLNHKNPVLAILNVPDAVRLIPLFEALLGPHGYTVYKIMLIKYEEKHGQALNVYE